MKEQGRVVLPVPAEETGLVPSGWDVVVLQGGRRMDDLEGEVDLDRLDYFPVVYAEGVSSVSGYQMLDMAAKIQAYGSLGLAAITLGLHTGGRPEPKRPGDPPVDLPCPGFYSYEFPRTHLVDKQGKIYTAKAVWSSRSSRWELVYEPLVNNRYRTDRLIRPRRY